MQEEKPPFLKTWTNIYLLIVVVLVAIIISLTYFTKYFA